MLGIFTLAFTLPFSADAAGAQHISGATRRIITYMADGASAPISVEILLRGQGPLVVLLPSLGRGAGDFDDLSSRISAAGFRTAAINPRGVGASKGPAARSLDDYARDVFEVIKALQDQSGREGFQPAVLIGHAFGNRWARATASHYPDAVSSLVLLASGGQVAIPPAVAKALYDVFDPSLSPEAHISAVQTAFFAPGNDPHIWRDGWFGAVAMQQQAALKNSPLETWGDGGRASIYIIQAAQDVVAPPANAHALRQAHPDRVEIAILENAGHAMLPEQPQELARLILERLARLPVPPR